VEKGCYCKSGKDFSVCCEVIISGEIARTSAETCMRSRYSAYCIKNIDYIIESTFPSQRKFYPKKSLVSWANSVSWLKLEIVSASENLVEFKAYFKEGSSEIQIHHEKSLFKEENGIWYFYEGEVY
jgi:SEC-C motif-containing protein